MGSEWRETETWAGMQSSVKFKCQMSNLLDAAGQPRLGNVFFVFFSVFFFVYGFLVKGGACY